MLASGEETPVPLKSHTSQFKATSTSPQGQAPSVLESEEVRGINETVNTHQLSDHRLHVYPPRYQTSQVIRVFEPQGCQLC